jgi:hypothetical protein
VNQARRDVFGVTASPSAFRDGESESLYREGQLARAEGAQWQASITRAQSQETEGGVMTASDRLQIARESYLAFAAGDRSFFEKHLSKDFRFSSPPDPALDREGWFERCWPGAGRGQDFKFVRLVEAGDEVLVTYEIRWPDGRGGRNTEILAVDEHNMIVRTEVYFGWDLA